MYMYVCHGKDVLVEMVSYKAFVYYHRSNFTSLLESGDLTEKSSIQFTPQDSEFPVVLAKVCFYHHFRGKAGIVITGRMNFVVC